MKEKRTGAYLTVFLSLLLASFLAFIMALSDGIQRNTMLVESEIALDTACYSALAEYHKELLKQYDLFFIDSSLFVMLSSFFSIFSSFLSIDSSF